MTPPYPPRGGSPYLVYLTEGSRGVVFPADEVQILDDRLHLVVTTLDRSRLYHRIKRQLPPGTPLLVAPLGEPPKFKGMAAGALAFTRRAWS